MHLANVPLMEGKHVQHNETAAGRASLTFPLGLYTAYSLHSLIPSSETALQQAESGEGMICVVPCFPPSGNIDYLNFFQCSLVDTLGTAC